MLVGTWGTMIRSMTSSSGDAKGGDRSGAFVQHQIDHGREHDGADPGGARVLAFGAHGPVGFLAIGASPLGGSQSPCLI